MKGLAAASVDLFICDLPYGCLTNEPHKDGSMGKSKGGLMHSAKSGCAWDVKIDLVEFWKQVKRLCKSPSTPVLMFCNTRFGAELISSNPSWFRYDLVWSKSNGVGFLHANKQPLRSHEMIYVFAKKGANYKRIDIKGDFPAGGGGRSASSCYTAVNSIPNTSNTTEAGRRCVKSVIDVANKKEKGGHPTAKPPDLYRWLIERYSNEGDTVLDPTAGSFNSCRVAQELKRRPIGIEKDPGFFWRAVGRVSSIPPA
jgi:site-specific DNA-methyltransferase (adenine-specific)